MKYGRTLFYLTAFLLLVLSCPTVGAAETVTDVTSYFSPATGTLLSISGDDYLVSLDARSGVMAGDLLTIVAPGEKLVDPASGTVLGNLDRVKGVLKVTAIRSGFSQARPIGPIENALIGDTVRRYQNLTVVFKDQNGDGADLYQQLVAALPALEWQGYYPVDTPTDALNLPAQLTFLLTERSLEVYDSNGQILRSFASTGKLRRGPSTPSAQTSAVNWERPRQDSHESATYSADYPGFRTLGQFPSLVLMADFLTTEQQTLVVSSSGGNLEIAAVTEQLQPLVSESLVQQDKIHAVTWWQPETAAGLYLAVTATSFKNFTFSTATETVFSSAIYRFNDGKLTTVARNLPYLLGAFDRNGDGAKETLLGQRFDLDGVFGSIKELKLNGTGVSENGLGFDVPLRFPVQGSTFADLTGDGELENIYTRNGILFIVSNGKLRYESSKQMGGSLSRLTYDVNPGQADALFTSVAFEVPPFAADIDGDGQLELIAVSTDRSGSSTSGLEWEGSESWLSVIKYRNGRFVKGSLGEKLEKPIQGLTVTQGQALLVLTSKGGILNNQGQSHLLSLPLAP